MFINRLSTNTFAVRTWTHVPITRCFLKDFIYCDQLNPICTSLFWCIRYQGGTVLWTEDNFVFGQIWKFRFFFHLWHKSVIWDISSHIWRIKKQILGSKFSKNGPQKQKKWENAQKQPILDMFWCIRVTKPVSPEFGRSCRVIICSFFADEDGWETEK